MIGLNFNSFTQIIETKKGSKNDPAALKIFIVNIFYLKTSVEIICQFEYLSLLTKTMNFRIRFNIINITIIDK
jgi:hypothetical protein